MALFAIDDTTHTRVGAVKFVRSDHPRAHRAEGVERFTHIPLLVAHLHIACGHIVDDGVAENMLHGICGHDVFAAFANDDGKFGFIVNLFRHLRAR